jgi:hypothetical protein
LVYLGVAFGVFRGAYGCACESWSGAREFRRNRFAVHTLFDTFQLHAVIRTLAYELPFSKLSKEDIMEDVMALVIEFYIPTGSRKRVKWIAPAQRGKVLEFPAETRKSA